MRRQLHWLFVGLALFVLAFLATVWASAAALPEIGRAIEKSAHAEAPLTTAYIVAGKPLRSVGFLRDFGDGFASEAFAPLRQHIIDAPELAMEIAHVEGRGARHSTLLAMHWVPWIALAIALVIYLRRPRAVHLYGSRRR